jgi:hypothetical protein
VSSFVGKQVFTLAARMDGAAAHSLRRVDSRQGSEPWSLQLPKTPGFMTVTFPRHWFANCVPQKLSVRGVQFVCKPII